MKIKKSIIMILSIICLVILGGCSSQDKGARKLWNDFTSAVNEKNNEKIALTFFEKDSNDYNSFLENEESFRLFSEIDSIKTQAFDYFCTTDFTSAGNGEMYYAVHVKANIICLGDDNDYEFDIYMNRNKRSGWKFSNVVNINPFEGELGNTPNDQWLRSALYNENGFLYKKTYTSQDGQIVYNGITLSSYDKNAKNVVIPSEIEGLPVTSIQKFAFMKQGKIFQITYSNSKMSSLVIPETVTTIGDYAFFQCKNLRELNIPASVKSIGEYAFASSTKIGKLVFNIDDSEMYNDELLAEVASESEDGIVIKGAHNMYVGDIINLQEASSQLVTWSVDKTNVATIDPDKGILTAVGTGDVTITATLKSNPAAVATVTLSVSACPETLQIKIQSTAFDRLDGLKELYINARNPFLINLTSALKLSSKVTIYVPKGSLEMYQSAANWSAYKEQIQEM